MAQPAKKHETFEDIMARVEAGGIPGVSGKARARLESLRTPKAGVTPAPPEPKKAPVKKASSASDAEQILIRQEAERLPEGQARRKR